jgi:hypothetical protein
MYNTLYDDDNHGLELARLKKSQGRALRLVEKAGFNFSSVDIESLSQQQLNKVIAISLAAIESRLRADWDALTPDEQRAEAERLKKRRDRVS